MTVTDEDFAKLRAEVTSLTMALAVGDAPHLWMKLLHEDPEFQNRLARAAVAHLLHRKYQGKSLVDRVRGRVMAEATNTVRARVNESVDVTIASLDMSGGMIGTITREIKSALGIADGAAWQNTGRLRTLVQGWCDERAATIVKEHLDGELKPAIETLANRLKSRLNIAMAGALQEASNVLKK